MFYEFAWVVKGFELENNNSLDLLYKTFEDADVGASSVAGRVVIDFVVEASGPFEALFTTFERFTATFPQVQVICLDRDLVSINDIAGRIEQTPDNVILFVVNNDFPTPVGFVNGGIRVWEWAAVVDWFSSKGQQVEGNTLINNKFANFFDLTCQLLTPELVTTLVQGPSGTST